MGARIKGGRLVRNLVKNPGRGDGVAPLKSRGFTG